MADGTVDPSIVKKTQDTLGKIISKPPLTEKLLQKPPFRFLHDICTAVIKKTGFMNGLFTSDEMNSENVKDRDAKIAFLQKVIDMVALVNGRSVSVRPSSIISGKECDLTNEMLQAMAEAISKKVDNDAYVAKVLRGETSKTKEKESSKDSRSREKSRGEKEATSVNKNKEEVDSRHKSSDKSREKDREKDKERERRHHSKESDRRPSIDGGRGDKEKERDREKEKEKEREKEKNRDKERPREDRDSRGSRDKDHSRGDRDKVRDSRDREREKDRGKEESREKDREKQRNGERDLRGASDRPRRENREQIEEPPPNKKELERNTRRIERRDEEEKDLGHGADINQNQDDPSSPPVRIPRPVSAKGHRRRKEGGAVDSADEGEEIRPPLPSKPSGDSDDMKRQPGRPPTARAAPPKPRRTSDIAPEDVQRLVNAGGSGKVTGLIIEREQDSDDDQFVVEETIGGALDSGIDMRTSGGMEMEDPDKGEHGGLVQKMLQSKKSYESGGQAGKTETEKTVSLDEAARKRERVATEKEVERIRNSLQTLTRSANPLAKVMDFIQEDLDAMQRELERWRKENKDLTKRLKQEQSISDSRTDPLKVQLQDLEQVIKQQYDAIALMKAKIAANDEKICNMLTSVSSHS